MDQSKLLIPSLLHVAKSYSGAWKLRTHLAGFLNHGREILAFLDVFQWPYDSNYTMNVLLRTLKEWTTFLITSDYKWTIADARTRISL